MSARRMPWVEKYRPKRIEDVAGNPEAKRKFIAWLNSWVRGKPTKKAALLYGPPGCGKTSIVHAAAREYGLELIEANASDVRTSEALKAKVFRAATEHSLFGRGRIILLDEIDGISPREDRGGLETVIELIKVSKHPVVLTANNPWDPRLRSLRDLCEMIEFKKLGKRDIMRVLANICRLEGIECSREVLSAIADRAKGDLRAAINDLQSIAEGRKKVTLKDLEILGYRAEQADMFTIVRRILTARNPLQAKVVLAYPSLDYEMLMQWLNENIPSQYSPSLVAIADAYDALSRADVFLGRIKRRQKWALLPYALELMTVGVASAREKPPFKFVKYSFPQRIKLMAATKNRRDALKRVAMLVGKAAHISRRRALLEVIPYIKLIYEVNPKLGARLLKSMRISETLFKEAFPSLKRKRVSYARA